MILLDEIKRRISLGEQIEEILKKEGWKDFEKFVSEIISENGFLTINNFRFSYNRKRNEIDIIAIQNPRIILIDCKHWKTKYRRKSALKNASLIHYNRGMNFTNIIKKLSIIKDWKKVIIILAIVTLYEENIIEMNNVYIVPLFKIISFLECAKSGLYDNYILKI
ncbi:MAG: restriction endonuclease [Candidatus Methanomethylicia archaeon]|jgi:Holliday junction resolvase|nr:restriction endonuclease [Candidatus Methanomethylicia archaeon]MCQ5340142.1 restriction endonuclease [Candidatus Methanomethylicia archaeon]